jgi:hypothetical protein
MPIRRASWEMGVHFLDRLKDQDFVYASACASVYVH